MIKTIFFDVDGTLMSHTERDIPESTKYALDALRKKGIKIVLATGRHRKELDAIPVSKIEFDGYLLLNGQMLLDHDFHMISSYPMKDASMKVLEHYFNKKEFPLLFVEEEGLYINFINHYVDIAQDAISTPNPVVREYHGAPVYQAVAYVQDDKLKELQETIPNVTFTRWNKYGVDIISKDGGKKQAILSYMKDNHLKKEEVMAFGDGENDMGMLEAVGIGVAMGNAEDHVKQCADYITDSVDDDGIYNALVHFHIL